jgi:hypothetical protein
VEDDGFVDVEGEELVDGEEFVECMRFIECDGFVKYIDVVDEEDSEFSESELSDS